MRDEVARIRQDIERRALASPLRLDGEPVVTVKQAAAYCDVSHHTILRWCKANSVHQVADVYLVKLCELSLIQARNSRSKVSAA